MKKRMNILLVVSMLLIAFVFSACGQKQETPAQEEATTESAKKAAFDGAPYGYDGTDPVEFAVYKYMVDEVAKEYDKADVSIPTVAIVYTDTSNADEILVYGDFWIENYNIKEDTLECESGGNYPGIMHVVKEGDGYVVKSFDIVADGEDFDKSAKELFGDHYDDFMKVYSDDVAREDLRKKTVANYVKLNKLKVTQYKDYGWDPVVIDK